MKLHSKILAVSASFIIVFSGITAPPSALAQPFLRISAPSALLLDPVTNRVIYSKTPYLRRQPASTTKVLTAIVAYEHFDLDKIVTIQRFAQHVEPSKMQVFAGERFYSRDLIRATLIKSANDAAEVLAVAVAGSMPKFAAMMNKKAREIGCRGSHFVRSSGLPASNQYSTAYDLAIIMRYMQRYPFLVETMKVRTMNIHSLAGRRIYLRNHNKMLWRDPRPVIGKTGWTRAARHCFVGRIGVRNRSVLVALMGSHALWRDLKTLVDFEFGTSFFKPKRTIKSAASVEKRRLLQTALKRAGFYRGRVDGVVGTATLRALKRFQKAKRLPADGIAGRQTWQKLQAYL